MVLNAHMTDARRRDVVKRLVGQMEDITCRRLKEATRMGWNRPSFLPPCLENVCRKFAARSRVYFLIRASSSWIRSSREI